VHIRRRFPFLAILFILLAGALALTQTQPSRGQGDDGFRFETLAHRGGASRAVALDGDRALIGEGEQVLVVDVRTPSAPRLIGRSPELGGEVHDIVVAESRGFVAAEYGGLVVLDLADPTAPRVLGRHDPGRVTAVAVDDGRAYISANARLQVVDVRDPASMQALGTLTNFYAEDQLAVVDGIVWAAERNGLYATDARDPAALRVLSTIGSHGSAEGLAATRERVYVANGWAGVAVFDVRDPARPVLIGDYDMNLRIVNDAALEGSILYVAGMQIDGGSGDWVGFVESFDVRGAPRPLSRAATGAPAESVAVQAGLSYVATSAYRFEPTANPGAPLGLAVFRGGTRVGVLQTLGMVTGVALSGRRALVSAGTSGLAVFDVTDPWSPVHAGTADTPGFAAGVAADNDVAIVRDGGREVRLYDGSRPNPLSLLGRFTAEGEVRDVAAERGTALVASYTGVEVVDIATPAAPRVLSRIDVGAEDAWLRGGLALLTTGGLGLRLLDLAAPERPALLGQWSPNPAGPRSLGVTAAGGRAYVGEVFPGFLRVTRPPPGPTVTPGGPTVTATPRLAAPLAPPFAPQSTLPPDAGRLSVLDIRTPEAPAELGRLDLDGPASALAVDEARGRLFLAGEVQSGWGSILQAVDVTDAARPSWLGGRIDRLDDGGITAGELVFQDGLLYVAAFDEGFWILRPVAPGDPSATPTATRADATATPDARPTDGARGRVYLPKIE